MLAFGIAALVVAARQLLTPKAGRAVTAQWLMGLTAVAGVLGTATGVQNSARYIMNVAADKRWVFAVGLMESLNNLVAAFVIISIAMLMLMASHVKNGPTVAAARTAADKDADRDLGGAARVELAS